MKKTTLLFCTLAAGSALFSCSAPQQETAATDYTQYVNTFIGAAITDILSPMPAVLSV